MFFLRDINSGYESRAADSGGIKRKTGLHVHFVYTFIRISRIVKNTLFGFLYADYSRDKTENRSWNYIYKLVHTAEMCRIDT